MQRRIIQQTILPKLKANSTLFSRTAAITKPRSTSHNIISKPFSTSLARSLSDYYANMSLFPRYHSHRHSNGAGSSDGIPSLWRLLDDPFFVPTSTSSNSRALFQPKFDVHETPEAFILDGELPGITDKNAIDIHFTDQQTLVIHGRVEKIRKSGPEDEDTPKKATVEDAPDDSEAAGGSKDVAKTDDKSVSKQDKQQPTHRVWVQERSVGEFMRSFNFPAGIDQEAVKASLKDGILTVTVPKAQQKGKRRINIE